MAFWNLISLLFMALPFAPYVVGFIKEFVIAVMKTAPVPKHIALIMDGNRRFAKNNAMPLVYGHTAGAETLYHVRISGRTRRRSMM